MEFDDQLLDTPNSAKLTNSFKCAWRKVFKLKDINTDALQGPSKLSSLFKKQSCTFSTYKSDVKSTIDLYFINTPTLNSILDGSSKYPLPRSLSIPLLDNSKELLTLENNTIIDTCTLISTVISTDLINTHY